jgi:ADP-ribosyl-[dinitrogen reductase] hydrolase
MRRAEIARKLVENDLENKDKLLNETLSIDDRDHAVTAAVAGQLGGALYGASGIPKDWLDPVAWKDQICKTAAQLWQGL